MYNFGKEKENNSDIIEIHNRPNCIDILKISEIKNNTIFPQ